LKSATFIVFSFDVDDALFAILGLVIVVGVDDVDVLDVDVRSLGEDRVEQVDEDVLILLSAQNGLEGKVDFRVYGYEHIPKSMVGSGTAM
jgi:hypothetical protein